MQDKMEIEQEMINEQIQEETLHISTRKIKNNKKKSSNKYNDIKENQQQPEILDDKYNESTLIKRFTHFKQMYMNDEELIKNGLRIRHQNTPEDITENITKFIIKKYENDESCVWCKGVDKKYGLTGDLYSNKYKKTEPIEVKSFTSNGPSQFGPDKKFGVLYFLDLRKWLNDKITLWKVNVNHTSDEFKNMKINKNQTMGEQLLEGRRPHISWDNIYSQISDHCEKVYEGSFENIFSNINSNNN